MTMSFSEQTQRTIDIAAKVVMAPSGIMSDVGGTKSSKHHLLITAVQSELFYGTEV